jgi:hypothetical protein
MKKVSKTLNGHLSKVTELISRIENREGGVSQIEVDMLLAALREMYDAVYRLPDEVAECTAEKETPVAEPVAEQTEPVAEQPEAAVATADDTSRIAVSVLMVDNEAEAVFAAEPAEEAIADYDNNQPSREESEGQPNAELFEEQPAEEPVAVVEPAAVEEPAAERVEETPQAEEQPKTLWNKLQDSQSGTTIAEKIGTAKSISDLMEEKALQKQEIADAEPAEAELHTVVEPEKAEQPVDETVQAPAETLQEPKPAQPSLFDYFKSSSQEKPVTRTIADSLGSLGDSVEQKVTGNKVRDLRTIININDKFSFMNELFHNNMKGYNEFILRLNDIDDREEALAYVGTIAEQYAWDNDSLAVKTFYSIFDRKF